MSSQNFSRPLWKEGMFLAPQHMQQSDNYRDAVGALLAHAQPPFPWGIISIDIDSNLLSSQQFAVHQLEAIAPTREALAFPGNIEIPSRSFEGVLTDPQQKVKVYLGIPDYEKNGPNLLSDQNDVSESGKIRYCAHDIEFTDENSGILERTLQVRRIRGRLFFEGEDTQGHQLLPIARIQSAPSMDGAVLDKEYIPPVLSISAWPPLQTSIDGVAAKLTAVQSNLSRSFGSKSVAEWCTSARGIELMLKMQAVNQAAIIMQQISNAGTLIPFFAYTEILRAIGLFSAFRGEEQVGIVPMYDHLRLGESFGTSIEILRKLCARLGTEGYTRRKFVLNQGRMEVDLEADWLSGQRKLYLCISGAGDYTQVVKRMTAVRSCAPSHFSQVLKTRIQALQLQWLRKSPSSLPAQEGSVYAEIMQSGRFWPGVVTEMALAVGSSEKFPYSLELFVE